MVVVIPRFSFSLVASGLRLLLGQVHTLLKGLEKIAASADIPMLVAGDFNSIPARLVFDVAGAL